MALSKKEENRVSARVFSCLSLLVGLVLLVVGVVCWKAGTSVVTMVNKGIAEEKIYFPPAGSPAFNETAFPDAQKHAGKLVDDGAMAKAFAEDYLGVQLKLVGGGKTGSEVGAMAAADPQNAALQQQAGAMFQLGTSKALLLSAYGGWSQGMMMRSLGMVALVASVVLLLVAGAQYMRYKKQ